jgi:LL-diaminopimelate aminotransferase
MTGWRVGFAVGNPQLIGGLNKLKSYMDSRLFPAVDMAGAYALEHVDNSATFELYRKRRDILVDGLNSLGWRIQKPKATLYVWAAVPSGYTSMEFAKKLLHEADVLVVPGIGYGEYGDGYIRMSVTVEGDRDGELVAEAVDRIRRNVTIKW